MQVLHSATETSKGLTPAPRPTEKVFPICVKVGIPHHPVDFAKTAPKEPPRSTAPVNIPDPIPTSAAYEVPGMLPISFQKATLRAAPRERSVFMPVQWPANTTVSLLPKDLPMPISNDCDGPPEALKKVRMNSH